MDEEKAKRIQNQIRRAKKISFLKLLGIRTAVSLAETESIRAKKNVLKKLYVTQKVPKDKRTNVEELYKGIKKVLSKEAVPLMKDLIEPNYFVCTLGGFLMEDPVTIESGRTYDRSSID